MEQKSNGRIFCFKYKFLKFSETKKFSTDSFLTFRELQLLVSYKQVSYKKICVHVFSCEYCELFKKTILKNICERLPCPTSVQT